MKKMKRILIAVFACIVVCGVSVPVIAANMKKADVPNNVKAGDAKLSNAVAVTSVKSSSETLEKFTEPEPEEAPAPQENQDETDNLDVPAENGDDADTPTEDADISDGPFVDGEGFVDDAPVEDAGNSDDTDSAEIADTNVGDTEATPVCPYYVDANGDGVCDHCAHNGACGYYTDANGDGVCDYCTHNGSGHCGSYADSNGDGVCDNYTGSGSGQGYGRHHGGGHHGGRHHW